jgi:hypothetical protein
VRAGRQADDSGLNPVTEAPFYDLLKRELADEGKTVSSPMEALLRELTVDVVTRVGLAVQPARAGEEADPPGHVHGGEDERDPGPHLGRDATGQQRIAISETTWESA